MITRRNFMRSAAAVTMGFGGLQQFVNMGGRALAADQAGSMLVEGYGALTARNGWPVDLPAGFECKVISRVGELMADGFRVPGKPDGMAAFSAPEGLTAIVCNHELSWGDGDEPWTPEDRARIAGEYAEHLYDPSKDGRPCGGGTSTILYNTKTGSVVRQHLSLAGTLRNCAGGPTPWGTWVTCEETTARASNYLAHDHGYNFEVPALGTELLRNPVPLRGMGRFNHEAIAVDPNSGIVYQTEDRGDGLIYRYIPDVPGELAKGGRLQCLALADTPSADTRNWEGNAGTYQPGQRMAVRWIDAEEIDSPEDDMRTRMHAKGAACFARGEGMWYGNDSVYFACTNGGPSKNGQIWRYFPGTAEGQTSESADPGQLELFIEPNNPALVDRCDNVTVAPWGDLIVCEDGNGEQFVLGITPAGNVYKLARNNISESEFAGSTFSPDGTTLFVNIQQNGLTLAITGPWDSLRTDASA